ncbi:MAG: hypothetical protein RBS34_02700 [Desulfofustis sp.]|jgi:hypothetical protein|nr:hypothetical protein [Desulfofustis sp.]
MQRTIDWQSKNGNALRFEINLALEKEINLDGDKSVIACCELSQRFLIDGQYVGDYINRRNPPKGLAATVGGRLGLTVETLALIDAAIAEVTSHPAWQAKQAKIAANRAGVEKLESTRRANGLCPRCGTYCHGDCSSN